MDIRFSKYPAHYTVLIIFFVGLINGFYLDLIYKSNIVAAWAYDISQFIILPFTLFFILYKHYNIRPSSYGIIIPTTKHKIHSLIYASIYCAALLQIFWFVTYEFVNMYVPGKVHMGYLSLIPSGLMKFPVVVYMSVTAAVVEEVTYRGLPLLLFNKFINHQHINAVYILTTAMLFSLVHWENGADDLAATFVFGIFAAMLYLHYKNLIPLIFAHFIGDFVAFW